MEGGQKDEGRRRRRGAVEPREARDPAGAPEEGPGDGGPDEEGQSENGEGQGTEDVSLGRADAVAHRDTGEKVEESQS